MISRAVDTYISSGYEPEKDVEAAANESLEVTAEDRSHWDYAAFADTLKRKYGPDIIPENLKTLERDDLIRQCVSLAEKIKEDKIKAYGITWDFEGLQLWAKHKIGVSLTPQICQDNTQEELEDFLYAEAVKLYEEKEKRVGAEGMRLLERYILLQIMDSKWKDHLYAMDHLRDSVGFRGYGGKDPKVEYKKEGFAMFSQMIDKISEEVTHLILRVEFADRSEVEVRDQYGPAVASKQDFGGYKGDEGEGVSNEPLRPYVRKEERIGRNDPCPCGSGKKYKKCCGVDAK
jgi:preprotein translocase subunit SecA